MNETGILFSDPMVLAIIEGRKTQTRRTRGLEQFNANPDDWAVIRPLQRVEPMIGGGTQEFPGATSASWLALKNPAGIADMGYQPISCPYGGAGDRLWLREAWGYDHDAVHATRDEDGPFVYRADGASRCRTLSGRWRPSIFMPRWASRLTLEITEVRCERLQSIREADAIAEGVAPCGGFMTTSGRWTNYGRDGSSFATARESLRSLWNTINAKRGLTWEINPWVWAISFRRVEATNG